MLCWGALTSKSELWARSPKRISPQIWLEFGLQELGFGSVPPAPIDAAEQVSNGAGDTHVRPNPSSTRLMHCQCISLSEPRDADLRTPELLLPGGEDNFEVNNTQHIKETTLWNMGSQAMALHENKARRHSATSLCHFWPSSAPACRGSRLSPSEHEQLLAGILPALPISTKSTKIVDISRRFVNVLSTSISISRRFAEI